jgi:OmpA-OmpF porin, OOP family
MGIPRWSWLCVLVTVLTVVSGATEAQQRPADVQGGRDHPLVGRFEGSRLSSFLTKEFETSRFLTGQVTGALTRAEGNERRNNRNSIEVSGRTSRLRYEGPAGRSALEVVGNFREKLVQIRFEQIFACRGRECGSGDGADFWFAMTDRTHMLLPGGAGLPGNWAGAVYAGFKLVRPEGDVYVSVYSVDRPAAGPVPSMPITIIDVVETRGMATNQIVFVDASAMERAIGDTGRVALYGILFDTGSADLRSESANTLAEIATYLRRNATTNLIVTGHTDSQGAFDYNVDLSRRRAQAVVAALVRDHQIAPQRLTPFGAGMAAPVATNVDEAGRQRNRRVELVRR